MNPNTSQLPNIETIKALGTEDRALLKDLAAVFNKHNSLDRIGICLLHQHFPIEKDEILLERTNTSKRVQTITPAKSAEVSEEEGLLATSWKLTPEGRAIPLQFCMPRDHYNSK